MNKPTVSPEQIKKIYRQDCITIVMSIFIMISTLLFVLTTIVPQSPTGTIRTVMIAAALSVATLATFALLRVLSHLKRHKEKLYSEDIREGLKS